jgi:hypothetical protein
MARAAVLTLSLAALAGGAAQARSGAQTGFPPGGCTAWTYLKRPAIVDETELRSLTPSPARAITEWDAWLWATNARRGGFRVGTRPAVGAVAVWPRNTDGAGPLGHVAYVERVLPGGDFLVSEQNWDGRRYPTRRVVEPNHSLRFIYRAANEPRKVGDGRLLRFSTSSRPDKPVTVTLRMSGPGDVLARLTGAHGFASESARVLPAGTTTLPLPELLGRTRLPAGSYTLWVLVVGGGGSYQYLPVVVA